MDDFDERRLTAGIARELLMYDAETGKLHWRRRARRWFKDDRAWNSWNARFVGKDALAGAHKGYRRGRILGITYLAHRVVWLIHHGDWPKEQTDHINGIRADNRMENLREVTPQDNAKNQQRKISNSSGVMGVYWHAGVNKWVADIRGEGRRIYLGSFNSFDDAVNARLSAEINHGYHENHGREGSHHG